MVATKHKFDLEGRTLDFSKCCIDLCKPINKNIVNIDIIGQLLRSAGSVGANYREANDSSTKKDFYYRVNICRKEAKESKYWLELLVYANVEFEDEAKKLIDEAERLTKIFASIVLRSEQ